MTEALADLHAMWRCRVFEETIRDLHLAGSVVGSVHLGIGQEAIAVGTAGWLAPQDALFATYRGHSWALSCGVPPRIMFAELLGRTSGVNGGRGGSAYLMSPEHRFFGENSIVGAGAPIAVGAALAGRFDGSGRVAVAVFGDGAMNQGSVHEAMNTASAMGLPVVFMCENNSWSEMTPIKAMVADDQLFKRAAAYGMPGERIDGNDPSAVRTSVGTAFERARSGGGPTLIEAMTARLVGHYIGDVQHYRPRADIDQALANDPIVRMRARLAAEGVEIDLVDGTEREARDEMADAASWASEAPLADPATARDHIYALSDRAGAYVGG